MPSYGKLVREYARKPQGDATEQVRCIYNCVRGSIAIRMPEGFFKCTNCKRIWQRGFNTYSILDNRGL